MKCDLMILKNILQYLIILQLEIKTVIENLLLWVDWLLMCMHYEKFEYI